MVSIIILFIDIFEVYNRRVLSSLTTQHRHIKLRWKMIHFKTFILIPNYILILFLPYMFCSPNYMRSSGHFE